MGLLLLAAATLKLIGLQVSPVPRVGWWSLPTVQLSVVALEVVAGLGLILDNRRLWPWASALSLFTAFAVVSFSLAMAGQAECGCFGTIPASPWAAFTVDLIVLALLVFGIPRRLVNKAEFVALARPAARYTLGTAAVLGLLAGLGILLFGSVSASLANLRGTLIVAPNYADFGTGDAGQT
ncbi:MAG: MauE/DoxX family redox-associated membrane protein, partial [Gemmataceae bacterium]